MSLLVLAYPQLEMKDYEWIQSFRAKHDERYFKVVEPNFTIGNNQDVYKCKMLADEINKT